MQKIIVVYAMLSAAVAFAQTMQGPLMPKKLSTAERRAAMIARMGGRINAPDKEPGICFLNCQKDVPPDRLEVALQRIRDTFHFSVYLRDAEWKNMPELADLAATRKHAVVVALVDSPAYPQLLTAPDDAWGIVNLAPLKADRPKPEVLEARVLKMMMRGFAVSIGGLWGTQMGDVLHSADTLQQLDANTGKVPGPMAFENIYTRGKALKVATGGTVSYRQACKEGWAPAPTNDLQRGVWNEFHPAK